MTTMKEILETAREIYQATQCSTGCCGSFEAAMQYIDGAVGEMIQEAAASAVALE